MIKICDYPCNNKREAEQEEDKYMLELKANMNMVRAFLTEEEKKEYKKQYREGNKEKNKEYRETNKERIQEIKKEYYETNKNTILEKLKEKITCKCGCEVVKHHKARHERTKKHLDLINQIQ